MSTVVFFTGVMIFVAHLLAIAFRKTQLPDVLVLMLIGILAGPVTGWVEPADFGKAGSVIATIALVVILFEGGTSLQLEVMGKALRTTFAFTACCFVSTVALVSLIAYAVLDLPVQQSLLLGMILGGTSSAVVIPMVQALRLGRKVGTVLVLESALTDVLCIVGTFALLQIITSSNVEPGKLLGSVLSAMVFAATIGVAGGLGWLVILGRVRDFPNTISSTLAYTFIVYGLTELLGFSGAIAALALGITLTNFEKMGLPKLHPSLSGIEPLTETDRNFYQESVFLLKTFFFVYLGISIRFTGWQPVLIALLIMVLVLMARVLMTRLVLREPSTQLRDKAIASVMAPKGLAAAVLAGIPLQMGISGGEVIRDTTFMVVLVSITVCALLVLMYPRPVVTKVFASALGDAPAVAAEKEPEPNTKVD